MTNNIIAFTDGASKGNPGPGGWGAIIVDGDHIEELGEREDKTTNNRMEMMAGLEVMKYAESKKKDATIYTDSSYLVNGSTKWIFGWQKNNWKTASKASVMNQDIWKNILEISKNVKVTWKLLPGHAGIPGNERADKIASDLADGEEVELFKGTMRDYKINIMDFSVDVKELAKKKKTKARSTGKAYSYISMIDKEIKTHKTWAECEGRVKGKTGAKFRKSLNQEQETEIIKEFREIANR